MLKPDWIEKGIDALRKEFPQLADDADLLGTRLGDTLCERVEDPSVGFLTLVERSKFVLGCTSWEGTEIEAEELSRRTTECFLKAAGEVIGRRDCREISAWLPQELRARMFGSA